MKAVIYSAFYGDKEPLNPDCFGNWHGVDRVILTDNPDLCAPHADVVFDPLDGLDPARASRRGKLQPHKYFADYDWSLYIDNNARMRADPLDLFKMAARQTKSGFHCFRHKMRDCIYDEARACMRMGKDDPDIITKQMARFRAAGYPERNGLITATFLLRQHNRPILQVLGECWFDMIVRGSRRDQLAFDYIAWQMAFKPDFLEGTTVDNAYMQWPIYPESVRRQDFAAALAD